MKLSGTTKTLIVSVASVVVGGLLLDYVRRRV